MKRKYKPGENAPGGKYIEIGPRGGKKKKINNNPKKPKLPPTSLPNSHWEKK